MRIGIDARFIGPEGTGLGVYTQNLVENLQDLDKKNQYIVFLNQSNWELLRLKSENFTKALADVPWYSLSEQIKMPAIFAKENLDLLHIPHFNVPIMYGGKFVVTIHDLIHKHFKKSATTRNPALFKLKRLAFAKVLNQAIKNSSKIITPSNFVKEDIVKNYKVEESKIIVTYEAAESEYFYQPSTVNCQPSTNYLLYVGNAYPHKNLNRMLDAIRLLTLNSKLLALSEVEGSTLKLILVCPRDVFAKRLEQEIKSRNLQKNVELKGYLQATDLKALFQMARAYVFPSLSEGFGIPALNAMAAGVPVVCSQIPTFKEVYAGAALYFDPNNPADIAKKINQVLTSGKTRSKLIENGFKQAQKYSWHKMAQDTLKVYESVINTS